MDNGIAVIIAAGVPTAIILIDRRLSKIAAKRKEIRDAEARELTAQHNREIAEAVKMALADAAKEVKQEVVDRAVVVKKAVDEVNGGAAELRCEVSALRAEIAKMKAGRPESTL